jgi:hypothetical protein
MRLIFVCTLLTSTVFGQIRVLDLENPDPTAFKNFFVNKKVIVVGEMHGTTQVPMFVLGLIQQLSQENQPISVGLEIPSNFQSDIDAFLDTGDFGKLLSIEHFKYADGRTSVAMGELIKGLRKIGQLKVVCFDVPLGFDMKTSRDSLMGVTLSEHYKGERMVILTGNLHANLKEGYWRPGFKSAIFHFNRISKLGDKLISLNTYFAGGTIWNCMQDGCKERNAGSNGGNLKQTFGLTNFIGIYNDVHTSGYSGFVYFDQVTASKPLIE